VQQEALRGGRMWHVIVGAVLLWQPCCVQSCQIFGLIDFFLSNLCKTQIKSFDFSF
jgi:hypothetical protein